MEETEVAHGASGSADVKRIARTDEDYAQAVEFGIGRQGNRVYSRREETKWRSEWANAALNAAL
jgi:hypothetical protein